jgi:prefoldin subunit 5
MSITKRNALAARAERVTGTIMELESEIIVELSALQVVLAALEKLGGSGEMLLRVASTAQVTVSIRLPSRMSRTPAPASPGGTT